MFIEDLSKVEDQRAASLHRLKRKVLAFIEEEFTQDDQLIYLQRATHQPGFLDVMTPWKLGLITDLEILADAVDVAESKKDIRVLIKSFEFKRSPQWQT